MAIDYLKKWVKARATRHNDAQTTTKFLYEEIFTRYGLPIELVSDQGTHFLNDVIATLLEKFLVIHNVSAPYHPQANRQAKSTNRTLCTVITKLITTTKSDWEMLLQSALWAYWVAYKSSTGTTPFNLVYGMNAILPMDFLIPTMRVAKNL